MKALLSPIFYLLAMLAALPQPQEAWVTRYNGGFTNKNHTPLAVKPDAVGNIYVAGSSRNASNVNDYVVLKYAPNGQLLWSARHSATNGANYTLRGFALDRDGQTYLTGSGDTVKLDKNGNTTWIVPYTGNDVAVDTNGNVYVTGFSGVQYATAKLAPTGSNLWVRTYVAISGPGSPVAVSQKLAVDNVANVYVAGWACWTPFFQGSDTNTYYYTRPVMLKYDTAGVCLWTNDYTGGGQSWGETKGLIADDQDNAYVIFNSIDAFVARVSATNAWRQYMGSPPPPVAGVALDQEGNAYVSGGAFLVAKVASTTGAIVWRDYQFTSSFGSGNGVALDKSAKVYVVANLPTSGFAALGYDSDGHQLWVKRYKGPANGNDGATGIAVAPDGSIYVTGYSANSSGGSDIVLIKYAMPTTIQKKTDGSILLQGYGLPSSNYTFQAGTNLLNWDPIGSSLADTNGLFQFTDTNAPLFPHRFYRWTQP